MHISPGDRPKLIALTAGIVVMLCLFCVTVVPRLLPRGPNGELLHGSAPMASTASAASPSAHPAGPTPIAPPVIGAVKEAPSAQPSSTTTDPFWRPLALSLLPPKMTAFPVRRPDPALSVIAHPDFHSRPAAVKLAPVGPPPLPEVELQGIVQDETAMAVLAIGGHVKFLQIGQTLGGSWVLVRIEASTVVLRQGRREVVLMLGQTLQKETPPQSLDVQKVADTLPPFHTMTLEP